MSDDRGQENDKRIDSGHQAIADALGVSNHNDASEPAASRIDGIPEAQAVGGTASVEDGDGASGITPGHEAAEQQPARAPEARVNNDNTAPEALPFPKIFSRVDNAIEEKIRDIRRSPMGDFMGINTESMRLLSSFFGGYELQPGFIEALRTKAQAKNMTLEQWLVSGDATPEEQTMLDNEKFDAFRKTSLLVQQGPESPHGFVGFKITHPFSFMHKDESKAIFRDATGAEYSEFGNKVSVRLPKDQKFGPTHALNTMRLFIAGRFKAPTADNEPQNMKFVIGTNSWGLLGRRQHIQDMMMLAAISLSKDSGIIPHIELKGMVGLPNAPVTHIDINNLSKKAIRDMEGQGLDVKALVDYYNGQHASEAPTVEGDTIPTAPEAQDVIERAEQMADAAPAAERAPEGVPTAPQSSMEPELAADEIKPQPRARPTPPPAPPGL